MAGVTLRMSSLDSQGQDNRHFFFGCPLFRIQRVELYNNVHCINGFKLDTLLFGSDDLAYDENVIVFEAVHKYNNKTL